MANPEERSKVQLATKSDLTDWHAFDEREGLISADYASAVREVEVLPASIDVQIEPDISDTLTK